MRSTIVLLILAILLIPSISVVVSGSSDEDKYHPMEDIPLVGYPQQDGGNDDRLFEYRSMWMEGYQIVNISEIKAVVKFARENNFNCLSPLINGHYLGVFYNSTIFPKYPEVKWDFDPLMELIKEAHKYNIQVMPWFHTMYSRPALIEHPQWRDMSRYGSYSWYWMDPSNPEVRSFLINETKELFENYPLDGIKLDTIRYGGSSMGYTPFAQQKYLDEGWTDYSDFRRNQITEVVEIIYNTIMDLTPWVWVGADIWHSYLSWYNYVFQDSRTWAQMGIIDFVTTMSYTTSRTSFANNLADNIANFNVPVVSGPYVYVPGNTAHGSVPNEQAGIDLLLDQTRSSRSQGALGTCNFAYKFLRSWPSYARALKNGPFSEKAICPLKEQKIPVKTTEWEFDTDHDRRGWRTTNTGQFYPIDGKWSVVGVADPGFMSPLLNITSWGINVIELTMISDARKGNISIYWSSTKTTFLEHNRIDVELANTADWELYSVHLDSSSRWQGPIHYVRIVTKFQDQTNITIDKIKLTWAPYCIRNWSFLGPFYSGTSEGLLERSFIDHEGSPLPRIGDVSSGRTWKKYEEERDKTDFVDEFGTIEDAVVYSHVYIRSTYEGIVEMRHGSSDGSRIWLNGEEIFSFEGERYVSPDENLTYTYLNKGINTLILKQAVFGEEISFFLRFTIPGNGSIEGLEYFSERPVLEPPLILSPSEEWLSNRDVVLIWDDPEVKIGLDHYEVSIDNGPFFNNIEGSVFFKDLPNGEHDVAIRCIDNLGFIGKEAKITIKIDDEIPIISEPIPDDHIVHEQRIHWDWEDLSTPISGIIQYRVTVVGWYPGSGKENTLIDGFPIQKTEYTLSYDIDDGHRYRIKVMAVSGSGLIYNTTSSQSVLVDSTPPTAPYGISIDHIRPGTRDYMLSWTESRENTKEGIEYYEVWKKIGNLPWVLHSTTSDTSMILRRPVGYTLQVKVRAKDRSSLFGDFSGVRETDNIPPTPQIIEPKAIIEGKPIKISTLDIQDPDGEITLRRWFVDGILVSSMDDIILTMDFGEHEIRLWVIDDQGKQGEDIILVNVGSDNAQDLDTSVKGWLKHTSVEILNHPPENITTFNNQTRFYDNGTDDSSLKMRTGLFDFMMVIGSSIMVLLLVLVFLLLVIGEVKGYGASEWIEEDEDVQDDQWEKKAIDDRRKLMESLVNRPAVRKMFEGKRNIDHRFPHAGGTDIHRPRIDQGSQSIMKYHASQNQPSSEKYDLEELEEWGELEEVDT